LQTLSETVLNLKANLSILSSKHNEA